MNKLFKYICAIVILAAIFVACEEDESTTYQTEIESVISYSSLFSYTGEHNSIAASYKDTLRFNLDSVKIYGGEDNVDRLITDADSADYEFSWHFAGSYDAKGFDNIGKKICDGYTLVFDGNLPPRLYSVVFVVKIKGTRLQFLSNLGLDIKSRFGEGLSIIDTKDNGETYSLNEIKSEHVTDNYQDGEDYTFLDIASLSRADYGEVTGLLYANINNWNGSANVAVRSVVVLSNGGDYYSGFDENYQPTFSGEGLFGLAPEYDNPKVAGFGSNLIINKGQMHFYNPATESFTYNYLHYDTDDTYNISQYVPLYGKGIGYDENKNRFLYVDLRYHYVDNLTTTSEDPEFLVEDMGAWDAINQCIVGRQTCFFVLREEGGSNIKGVSIDYSNQILSQKTYDLSGLENFDGTNQIAAIVRKTICYYTSGNKLYAFSTNTENPVSNVILELDADEEFTNFSTGKSYKTDVDFTNPNDPEGLPNEDSSRDVLMICGIYNNSTGEGRMQTIPVTNVGATQDCLETNPKYIKKFEGFGKIITWAWTSQKVKY